MDEAIVLSWSLRPGALAALLITGVLYQRGWAVLRRVHPARFAPAHAGWFWSGLAIVWLAIASPLDAFASLSLTSHMIQHLLLTMVAPLCLLAGRPWLPIIRGLPRWFAREAVAPILAWPAFQRVSHRIGSPIFGWICYVAVTLIWHIPAFYDAALGSPILHELEHASFLLSAIWFWWPVVQPWPARPHWPRWTMIVYLVLADVANTALAAVLAFSERPLYATYRAADGVLGMDAVADQTAAGMLMWTGGSLIFFTAAAVIAIQYLMPKGLRRPSGGPGGARWQLGRFPWLALPRFRFPKLWLPRLRRLAQMTMFALAIWIVWDGFAGSEEAPLNLAGVLPWTHWRGFAVLALLVAGNLFCMACPFTFARDLGRRFWKPRLQWPEWLRTKWLALALAVVYLMSYELFALWNWPLATAWIIVGYFVAAIVVDGLFKGGSFCKFVCPIGQFHFTQSLASPLEVKVKQPTACVSCKTQDCIKGNEQHRGCELELFLPAKRGNQDCTFCLDCVKACPHDNVGIGWSEPARVMAGDVPRSSVGRWQDRLDWVALIALFVFGAFINAVAMVGPVVAWLDGALWREILLLVGGLLLLPAAVLALLDGFGKARGMVAGLVPLGFAMWLAHFLFHLLTGWGTPGIAMSGEAVAWQPPGWVVDLLIPMELTLLGAGVIASWWLLWKTAHRLTISPWPWLLLAAGLYLLGVWIFLQPMEMRGTLL